MYYLFETFTTAFILTSDVTLGGVSSFRWVFKIEMKVGASSLFVKKLFKLSIKLLAKRRFPISSKCKPSRKSIDAGECY